MNILDASVQNSGGGVNNATCLRVFVPLSRL